MKNLLIIALMGCEASTADTQDTALAFMNVNSEIIFVDDNAEDESIDEELEGTVIVKPYPVFIINGPSGFTRCTLLDYTNDAINDKRQSTDSIYGWSKSYTSWGTKVLIPAICYHNNSEDDESKQTAK